MAIKNRLGKGLDGLIQDKSGIIGGQKPKESQVADSAVMVDVNKIDRNKEQPRKKFDEDSLAQLAESIKQYGVIQPLLVQDMKDHYEIIAGERRWRASIQAGLKEVPVIIKEYSDQDKVAIALIENIQREDLDAIEEAYAYKKLKEDFHLTDDQVAERVSKSRSNITNSMRLLKLGERVQKMLIDGMLSAGQARALLSIEDEEKQYEIAQRIFDQKLSTREVEKLVKNLDKPEGKKVKKNLEKYEIQFKEFSDKLADKLGTKVSVSLKDKNAGKLEIEFYSAEDFDKIYSKLSK